LIGAGHVDAWVYPLGMLSDESAIVQERQNNTIATEAQLIQLAAGSIMSKDMRKQFSKTVKSISVETGPREGLFSEGEVDGA